mgnify:FL=1
MPVYEFKCVKCGFEFERIVFPSDTGSVVCPQCEAANAERLLSTFCSTHSSGNLKSDQGTSCSPSPTGFS